MTRRPGFLVYGLLAAFVLGSAAPFYWSFLLGSHTAQVAAQGVPRQRICFIHHGIPDVRADREAEKARLGLSGRSLILTFGLLSPDKGIETAIRALPAVAQEIPNATYLVLGATHPRVRAQHGEAYREGLARLAADLGVAGHVRFDDEYAELDRITGALAAADVCLVPYLNREQITSGTLAYALGNGKVVVSTPFWHAEELLAEGRGVLVPFRDPAALGEALSGLLRDPARLRAILLDPERPVQIVIAGKAHPADDGGKQLVQDIVRFSDREDVRHHVRVGQLQPDHRPLPVGHHRGGTREVGGQRDRVEHHPQEAAHRDRVAGLHRGGERVHPAVVLLDRAAHPVPEQGGVAGQVGGQHLHGCCGHLVRLGFGQRRGRAGLA